MSGLRLPDTPHAQNQKQRFTRLDREQTEKYLARPRMTHVCLCVFSSHSFWTSSSLDVPAGVTQEEGHTGFLIHLLSAVRALFFLARKRVLCLKQTKMTIIRVVVVVVSRLKPVLTSIQYLLFLTLQGEETDFRGHKLSQNKVQKNKIK